LTECHEKKFFFDFDISSDHLHSTILKKETFCVTTQRMSQHFCQQQKDAFKCQNVREMSSSNGNKEDLTQNATWHCIQALHSSTALKDCIESLH
jgi:hypothetical protein